MHMRCRFPFEGVWSVRKKNVGLKKQKSFSAHFTINRWTLIENQLKPWMMSSSFCSHFASHVALALSICCHIIQGKRRTFSSDIYVFDRSIDRSRISFSSNKRSIAQCSPLFLTLWISWCEKKTYSEQIHTIYHLITQQFDLRAIELIRETTTDQTQLFFCCCCCCFCFTNRDQLIWILQMLLA